MKLYDYQMWIVVVVETVGVILVGLLLLDVAC